ncbi:MAG TPA: hypothetical protein VF138_08115 [Caulobacteraceae bacterium]
MQRLVLLVSAFALAGCVSTASDRDGTIQTTAEANRDGLGGAVSAPLRDVNLLRTKIPQQLLIADAEPYARPAGKGCASVVAEVRALTEVLGPDLDSPEERERKKSGAEMAGDAALGFVADTAQDVIPFRGWVRKLTGAERHDRLVAEAIRSGYVRRAYLKGLGEARGCNPPGTPAHLADTPEPISQTVEPRYPID